MRRLGPWWAEDWIDVALYWLSMLVIVAAPLGMLVLVVRALIVGVIP